MHPSSSRDTSPSQEASADAAADAPASLEIVLGVAPGGHEAGAQCHIATLADK